MTQGTLLVASGAAFVAGIAYAYLAQKLARDAKGASQGTQLRSFALWWAILAVNILLVSLTYLLAAFGALAFEMQFVVSVMQRILLAVSVGALLRYLLYLRTGRDALTLLIVVFSAWTVLSLYSMLSARPDGVFVGAWRTELTYGGESPSWSRALQLLLVLPSLVASVAYFLLYFRVEGAARRYRIAVVSFALIGWWVLAIVAGQKALLDVGWLQVMNRGASVLTAVLVLSAHHPPPSLRAWFDRRERSGMEA